MLIPVCCSNFAPNREARLLYVKPYLLCINLLNALCLQAHALSTQIDSGTASVHVLSIPLSLWMHAFVSGLGKSDKCDCLADLFISLRMRLLQVAVQYSCTHAL